MDWTDVEMQLREKVLEVCQHLLPGGKREGNEWVCGSVAGESGRSLKVSLVKPGLWTDFAGNHGGKNLMALWCACRGQEFRQAIVEAKGFLGIRDDFERRIRTVKGAAEADGRPEVGAWEEVARTWAQCQELTEGGPVWEYLVGRRRLAPEALLAYQVREVISKGHWVIVFPYFAAPGVVVAGLEGGAVVPEWLKFEALDRVGGKKREWTSRGPEKSLWGMQVVGRPGFGKARGVIVCEGEKDALTWASYGCGAWGLMAVSVPFGAKWKGQDKGRPSPNAEWVERCWDWLQGFEEVYVAMDSDEAGMRAAADIIREIGPRRCRMVSLPENLKRNAE